MQNDTNHAPEAPVAPETTPAPGTHGPDAEAPPHPEHHGVHVHTSLHAGFKGGDIQKGREGWVE